MALDQKLAKIYIDCSATVYSGLNTGIQRVVRNIIRWSTGVNSAEFPPVIPVVVLWGFIFEISPEVVQINQSKLITFGSQTKLKVESTRVKVLKSISKYTVFGRFLVALFEIWDRFLRLIYRVLKYSRVTYFVFVSGFRVVKPTCDDTFLFLDSFWLLDLPALFRRSLKECRKKIAVSYDIIPLLYPDLVEEEGCKHFTRSFDYLIRQVDGLLTISDSVAIEVRQYLKDKNYGLERLPIDHFYLGADFKPKKDIQIETVRSSISGIFDDRRGEKIWLMVGTIEPRKNHMFVFQAFDQLWKEGFQDRLLFVGRIGWKCEDILERIENHPFYGSKLIYLDDSSDDELQFCYSKASALIFASKTEGFGLPLVEAMHYKIPVLCSDIPVFREVGGDYPEYFSLSDPRNLAEKIKSWNKALARELKTGAGFQSWKESADSIIKKVVEF